MRPTKKLFGSSYERKPSNLPKRIQIWKKTSVDAAINVVQLLIQSDGEILLLLLKSSCSYDWDNCNCNTCVSVNLWQCFLSLSKKETKIPSRKAKLVLEASLRRHTFCQIVHQLSQIVTFFFLYLSRAWHLCEIQFII